MPHLPGQRLQKKIRVLLQCGHHALLLTEPWNPHSRYPCPAATGCGTAIRWVSFEAGEHTFTNNKFAKTEPEASGE